MRQSEPNARPSRSAAGFSLIELLVVVFIIAAMAAVSLPAIGRFIRNYQIRGASQQVATEINVARSKAINKNVNLGVVFAVVGTNQYRWVVEDDQAPGDTVNWFAVSGEDWATLTADNAQAGPVQTLPARAEFDDPTNCGIPAGPDTWGVRFNQLGSYCEFGTGTCGGAPPGATFVNNFVRIAGGKASVCVREGATNLRRWVSVNSGGRVASQP